MFYTPNTYNNNFKAPPCKPGVYFIVNVICKNKKKNRELLYIGSAINLKRRYDRHEVIRILRVIYEHIMFYFIEVDNYIALEKKLIRIFKPRFNKQHAKKT